MKKLRFTFLALVTTLVLMITACAESPTNNGYEIVNGVWEINNIDGLIAFRNQIVLNDTTSAKLVSDIDLNGSDSNIWLPIARNTARYKGTFDGNNHTISGLYINSQNANQGLFGTIGDTGVVKNLYVKDIIIIADEHIGAIAGENYGLIMNVYVDNARFTGNDEVGGVTSRNYNKIINVHVSNMTFNSGDDAGSIATYNENNGIIYLASAKNINITATARITYVGGIACGNSGSIIASYVDNVVIKTTGDDVYVGGIAGAVDDGYTISSYTNNVTFINEGNSPQVGEIIGGFEYQSSNNYPISNFFIIDNDTLSGIGETNDNISASPISDIAELNSNINDMNRAIEVFLIQNSITDGYRYKVVNDNTLPIYEAYEVPTEFLINNVSDLIEFRDLANAGLNNINAKLAADIDLNSIVWTSIGSDSNRYSGIFDGDNHTISNLTINATAEHQGLFGYNGGNSLIKNLKMNNVTITTTSNFAGAVVGTIVNTSHDIPSMVNVHVENVTISGNIIFGGLVGYIASGLIASSSATNVNITATGQADNDGSGGVVGVNDSNVVATYANGVTITAQAADSPNIGGVVGRNSSAAGTLTASYANNLSFNFSAGNAKVGGVTGWINEPTLLNSNFFVSGIGIGSLYGVGSVGAVLSSGPVANATRVGTIQELNNSANTMNNAIDAFVAGNASREFGYRYQAGADTATNIPTFITYP